MDPSGNKNPPAGNGTSNQQERREVQRRLRMVRAAAENHHHPRGGFRMRGGSNDSSSGGEQERSMARPEEAPSSMPRNQRSSDAAALAGLAAADPPAAQEMARYANVAALPNRSGSSADDGIGGEDGAANDPKFDELLQSLREFCRDGNNRVLLDLEKARNVLEACAGNVPLAAQLYLDDYLATQAQLPPMDAPSGPAEPPPPIAPPAGADPEEEERRIRRRLESDFERLLPQALNNDPPQLDVAAPPAVRPPRRRRRRRRSQQEGDVDAGGAVPAVAINIRNRHNVEEDVQMAEAAAEVARPPVRQAPPQPQLRPEDNQALFVAARAVLGGGEDPGEGSVSVSDDEGGVAGVLRMVRESGRTRLSRRRRRMSSFDESREAMRSGEIRIADEQRQKLYRSGKSGGKGGDDGDDDSSDSDDSKDGKRPFEEDSEDDAYLSESDWLFNDVTASTSAAPPPVPSNGPASQVIQNLRAPLDVLWSGLAVPNPGRKSFAKTKDGGDQQEKKDDDRREAEKSASDGNGNKKDPADDDESSGNNADNPAAPTSTKSPEIPSTWLHASFSAGCTAMGLALQNSKPEDVAEHTFRLQQISNESSGGNPRRNNAVQAPFHCRAISAVLSIVTAMMHTGCSIQSNQVTCSSSRVPFLELTEKDRTREFESRLIDALSALIFIAAKASMERKKKALAKRMRKKRNKRRKKRKSVFGDDVDDEEPDVVHTALERRLKLCPVTWWQETSQGAPNLPTKQWESSVDDASHTGPRIQVGTSFSNMADIRAYVLSNMESFTSPGGVALLLETIASIHGKQALKWMLHRSRAAAIKDGKHSDCSKSPYLVRCSCEERQKKRLQDTTLSPIERRKMTKNSLDTTPPSHECVSVELVSLLLTGKVHSAFKGWSTGSLGFGMLSTEPDEVDRTLLRPELPLWVLRGETCYTVLILDHTDHGDNLDEKRISEKASESKKKKKSLSPVKVKAAPCMQFARCSDASRGSDLKAAKAFASHDEPGAVARLIHWNPWMACSLRNLSGLRLITARPKWNPPAPFSSLANERRSVASQLLEKRLAQINVVSADEREGAEKSVDQAAMKRVRSHPQDTKFYPKQHRLWRFDMGENEGVADLNSKPRGDHWVPFHSLNAAEQIIVEAKFGPKIASILWTRWPGATIDKFTPEGNKEPLPVV